PELALGCGLSTAGRMPRAARHWDHHLPNALHAIGRFPCLLVRQSTSPATVPTLLLAHCLVPLSDRPARAHWGFHQVNHFGGFPLLEHEFHGECHLSIRCGGTNAARFFLSCVHR